LAKHQFFLLKQDYMKPNHFIIKVARLFLLIFYMAVFAHQIPTQGQNQLSRSLNLYVYPEKGQSADQQQRDEAECYDWAKRQTGLDPANMPKVQGQAPTETSSTGEAAKGAVAGAAAGAAIGAIVGGGAGEGAAIGGITGVIAGRRRGKKQMEQEQQQIQEGVSAQEQQNWSQYIRAFSGCIEGKGYSVK
jgi:Glycine zipper